MADIVVRPFTPDDWALARTLRLAALSDAPEAFAASYADTAARPEPDWREMLTPAHGIRARAEVDGTPAGLVGAVALAEAGVGELIWVWVDPVHRGRGVGPALVDFGIEWCARRGLGSALWVVDTNTAARRLYERVGFAATGERQPLPNDPTRTEIRTVHRPG